MSIFKRGLIIKGSGSYIGLDLSKGQVDIIYSLIYHISLLKRTK